MTIEDFIFKNNIKSIEDIYNVDATIVKQFARNELSSYLVNLIAVLDESVLYNTLKEKCLEQGLVNE